MRIAIPLFPRLTALDGIGPYEILQRLPGATVHFVGEQKGEIRTENGFLGLTADATFADVPSPDVIVVPGGVGTRRAPVKGFQLISSSFPLSQAWPGAPMTTSMSSVEVRFLST